MRTSVFSRVQSKSENFNVFIARDEHFYGIHRQKYLQSKFSFYFIVHTLMRTSDVITNVAKQNMNVMSSMFSA